MVQKKPKQPKHPFRRLLKYGRKYRTLIWQATACSVLNKLFDLAPPALIGIAVDIVVQKQDSLIASWGIKNIFSQLLILSFISLIVWGLESIFEYIYKRLWRNIAQKIQHDLRLDAYSHLQELELAYFEDRSSGGLLSILNDDINQLERFLDVGANEVIQVTTTVIIIGGGFFILAPSVAWFAMLPMPFIIWGSIWFQNILAPRYAEVREKVGLLNGQLANNLSGITTIKSFTAEKYEIKRIERESLAYSKSNQRAIALSAAFVPLIRILIFIGFIAILLLGGLKTVEGQLAVGTYSVLIFSTQRLLWPLTRLGETLDLYQRAIASTNRVFSLLDTPIEIHPGDIPLPVEKVRGELILENVGFAYDNGFPVIENITLKIPAGKTIAIVGSTGSGKSTLVKLLLRFYET
ncbi:MAG: ATP-binding cassette domain-containing protein, partial [Okeania sp. SIO2H7]|nr:ATP-binding cassette domain-containing protein [Okeania sp. SIO2H7]